MGSSFWAFLFPHVPFIPPVPTDVSDAGKSVADDAELFPSDEEMSQRALWISFLIVLGWSILGLVGGLPLYLVSTPCLAQSPSAATFTGAYSTLQDLSLMRLLRLLDNGNVTTTVQSLTTLRSRELVDGNDVTPNIRIRIIILTVLTIVVALLPALWKILKEFNRSVAYRRRWVDIRCAGKEMAWLSARKAPGFVGWGEKKLKDFILKTGLSSSLEPNRNNATRNVSQSRRRRNNDQNPRDTEEPNLEIDISALFSIG